MRKTVCFAAFIITFTLVLTPAPTQARSRQKAILDYLEDMRQGDLGFSNDAASSEQSISSSTNALFIYTALGEEIEDDLKLITFYQDAQVSNGGVAESPDGTPNLITSMNAVEGLFYLGINATELMGWKLFSFMNGSLVGTVYATENRTTLVDHEPETARTIRDFLLTSYRLGMAPKLDYAQLSNMALDYQYANGSYPTIDHAIEALLLLHQMGAKTDNPAGAARYVAAHQDDKGAFASTIGGTPSLPLTRRAISALIDTDTAEVQLKDKLLTYVLDMQNKDGGFGNAESSTVQETRDAILILARLNSLGELGSPEVLQTEGFISWHNSYVLIALTAIPAIRLTLLSRSRKLLLANSKP